MTHAPVRIKEQRLSDQGTPLIRVRCPHCGVRHWFSRAGAANARCPRSNRPISIQMRGARKAAPSDEEEGGWTPKSETS